MIITVTFNPAVDKTALSPGLSVGRVNRLSSIRLDAGGKGINASKVIDRLGGQSVAMGFVGGTSGAFVERSLKEMGLSADFVAVKGETRTNLKLVDPQNKTYTDLNEPGPEIGTDAVAELEARLLSRVRPGDIILLAGSVPVGVPDSIYAQWAQKLKAAGALVAVDLDGERLRGVIARQPWLIKPNDEELRQLLGLPDIKIPTLAAAAKTLCRSGVTIVVVSMGARGALFADTNGVFLANGPAVAVKSTVGAGDTVTAAMLIAHERGLDLSQAARLAVGAATAKVTREGSSPPERDAIEYYARQVTVSSYTEYQSKTEGNIC